MKTSKNDIITNGYSRSHRKNYRIEIKFLFTILLLYFSSGISFAHCDTMDGPLIADAKSAISQNNVNIVLKWVSAANEDEITKGFEQMMKVRELSADAKLLSEKYFFETLVRVHRFGEGVPYTGIKPEGTPIDIKIKAADKSIGLGNLSPLNGLVEKNDFPELKKRFNKVMMLKSFDIDDVKAGREYIEAYVLFFKFAEGETEGRENHCRNSDSHSIFNKPEHNH